ncbi:hypothetical protein MUCCIDRAFT_156979 [Mucor lusitanicus CBS 277.49]|uniref:Uncharacterized protein n=1 Tax=Mucor lusitanicus CBS 277.49 TaxID=747725 RepID=A0A168IND2_MUCCL|nr:hypothetical protein MUCCIDRAFT_156979 [Mucor lusitanicus CBS 277.49]
MSSESSPKDTTAASLDEVNDQLELVKEEIKGLNEDYEMVQSRMRAVDKKLQKSESINKELDELKAEEAQSKRQLEQLNQKVESTLSITEALEEKGVLDDDATDELLQIKIRETLDLIASLKEDVEKKKSELADLQAEHDD